MSLHWGDPTDSGSGGPPVTSLPDPTLLGRLLDRWRERRDAKRTARIWIRISQLGEQEHR